MAFSPRFHRALRAVATTFLAMTCWSAQAEKFSVVYSREIPEADSRLEYPVRLLELALKKSGVEFEIHSNPRPMPQGAALSRLASGTGVNVVWSMTSKEREDQLLPIRIPIDKGLFGYRIAFVREQNKGIFNGVRELEDLRPFIAGQGQDWPDTEILRSNGLKVNTSNAYEGLFPMLQAGRFDYFPRSILEVWDESGIATKNQLAIEERVVLYYPAAIYFFVNKKDTALARAIETGLNKAHADGSFDTLFNERFGDVIRRANLRGRVGIALNNPLMPPETPLNRKNLWVDLSALPK